MQFSAGEIFEMACQVERNGARFYRKASRSARKKDTQQLLLKLAEVEDKHLKTFAAMKEELTARERAEPVYDPDSEAGLYLKAYADARVFDAKADPSESLTGSETLEDLLKIAIGLEKDSIGFYVGIRAMVSEALDKDKIDRIIKEEMSHVATLSRELAAL